MPFNRSEKTENANNESSQQHPARAIRPGKSAKRAPNLNGINKQTP